MIKLDKVRAKIIIRGAVQGVGFRPFVYRIANELRIFGFVLNSPHGVIIEAESQRTTIDEFINRIQDQKPTISHISGMEVSWLDPAGFSDFEIRKSEQSDDFSAVLLPDISVCDDCLNELFDPSDRRYLYPFINCTNCGPRYSIIEALPYDRPNTSMKKFNMCPECKGEYDNPSDRRFHAQPVACPKCGPSIYLTDNSGKLISDKNDTVERTSELISSGKIVALKGLGGFQLTADPFNEDAVEKLRRRKNREQKPFALMAPSIEYVEQFCEVEQMERRLLASAEAPIVLLKRKDYRELAVNVAPGNPYLGVMLPYTPLHHLLLRELNKFIIATSGNISEEPMCIDNEEALQKLGKIADFFLMHNRPIVRAVDDSIVRVVRGKELILRRARGYSPFPVYLKEPLRETVLALGGHLKSTIALGLKDKVFVSQHIGDLSSEESFAAFKNTSDDLLKMYSQTPDKIITDTHPDYLSTKYAKNNFTNAFAVQHHLAHAAACKAENQIDGKILAVSWDGTGYGLDGTVWGSEFFFLDNERFAHAAQFRKFKLPGGEAAVKEPRRSLLGALYEIFADEVFEIPQVSALFRREELSALKLILKKNINTPLTSSAGRLFDAASALLNLVSINNFEGQAGMMLEFSSNSDYAEPYPFSVDFNNIFIVDWRGILKGMLGDIGVFSTDVIAAKFHSSLAHIILDVSGRLKADKITLSGGCFQNMILTEMTADLIESQGKKVYTHQRIPPNDGGISLGQITACNLKQVDLKYFV